MGTGAYAHCAKVMTHPGVSNKVMLLLVQGSHVLLLLK